MNPGISDHSLAQFTHLPKNSVSRKILIFHLEGKGGVFKGLLHLAGTKHSQVSALFGTAAVTELAGQLLSNIVCQGGQAELVPKPGNEAVFKGSLAHIISN